MHEGEKSLCKKGLFEKENLETSSTEHQKHRCKLINGKIRRTGVKQDTGHRATQTGMWKM